MTILAISGSPRQDGNADTAAHTVLEAVGAQPEFSFFRIADYNIKPCNGCWACRGGGGCSITDDEFEALLRKMTEADLLFFCDPVYWHAPPGIVKNAMDRSVQFSFAERDVFDGQRFALVTISEESGWKEHNWFPTTWFRQFGGEVVGSIDIQATYRDDLAKDGAQLAALRAFALDMAGNA